MPVGDRRSAVARVLRGSAVRVSQPCGPRCRSEDRRSQPAVLPFLNGGPFAVPLSRWWSRRQSNDATKSWSSGQSDAPKSNPIQHLIQRTVARPPTRDWNPEGGPPSFRSTSQVTPICRLIHFLLGAGNGDSPSSFRNTLCFAVDFRICFSMSTNFLCVTDRSIATSGSAVLT